MTILNNDILTSGKWGSIFWVMASAETILPHVNRTTFVLRPTQDTRMS